MGLVKQEFQPRALAWVAGGARFLNCATGRQGSLCGKIPTRTKVDSPYGRILMVLHWWSTLQARLRRPRRVSRRKTQEANLLLEMLEDRAVPSAASGFSQGFETDNTGFNYSGSGFTTYND